MEAMDSSEELHRWMRERGRHRHAGAPLGQILLAARLIDEAQLECALKAQKDDRGRHLGRILIEQGALAPHQVNEALAAKFGIPRVRPAALPIAPEALAPISAEIAARHRVMPVARIDATLVVAMENPFDAALLELLRFNTGLDVAPALAGAEEIALAHARYYSRLEEDAASATEEAGESPDAAAEPAGEEREANRRPIVRLLESILTEGVLLRASDINIRPEGGRIAIHYRVDGRMRHVRSLRRALLAPLVSRVKIIGQMNIAERRLAQEGRARIDYQGRAVDLRLSVIPTVEGESVVARILDREVALKPLAALGLTAEDERRVRRIVRAPHGLFLVTGPTGSGKSTTLYALLNELRDGGGHILTVEDPVEYRMSGIEQVQIADRIGYTFAEVLRRFLRHDPDVIMVGEIRDRETAAIACRAALTGHFVLSSLHTNDAPGAVARLIDMGIEPYVAASTLRGVMAQRLLRLSCPRCRGRLQVKGPTEARAAAPDRRGEEAPARAGSALPVAGVHGDLSVPAAFAVPAAAAIPRLTNGSHCTVCGGTGYAGRRVVCEVLAVTPGIAGLIERHAPAQEIAALARKEGMTRLSEHAMALAREGATSVEEALALTGT